MTGGSNGIYITGIYITLLVPDSFCQRIHVDFYGRSPGRCYHGIVVPHSSTVVRTARGRLIPEINYFCKLNLYSKLSESAALIVWVSLSRAGRTVKSAVYELRGTGIPGETHIAAGFANGAGRARLRGSPSIEKKRSPFLRATRRSL